MIRTWSVKNGGRLCECGAMKCEHKDGTGPIIDTKVNTGKLAEMTCHRFRDRAPETAEAA